MEFQNLFINSQKSRYKKINKYKEWNKSREKKLIPYSLSTEEFKTFLAKSELTGILQEKQLVICWGREGMSWCKFTFVIFCLFILNKIRLIWAKTTLETFVIALTDHVAIFHFISAGIKGNTSQYCEGKKTENWNSFQSKIFLNWRRLILIAERGQKKDNFRHT